MSSAAKEMTPEELRRMQLIQLELLKELDRVCRSHGIKYILDGGTLLGAVRHGMFIPWDDDIDVRMLRSEYEKFAQVAQHDLNSGIFFQSYKTDKGYPWLYSKLRKNGTSAVRVGQEKLNMHSGVFIDIFPCDGIPNNRLCQAIQKQLAFLCRKILYSHVARELSGSWTGKMFWTAVSWIPPKAAYLISECLSKVFDEKKCSLVGCLGLHGAEESVGFPREWFTDLVELSFEGHYFWAPKNWNELLRCYYGDNYMTPPPVEQQKAHNLLSSLDLGI